MTHVPNPPELVVEAAERLLRRLAIEGLLLEVVEHNLERIRVDLAHPRRSA